MLTLLVQNYKEKFLDDRKKDASSVEFGSVDGSIKVKLISV